MAKKKIEIKKEYLEELLKDFSYQPVAENSAVYNKLYDEYVTLCEYFAKKNHVMKRLKKV